MGCGSSLNQINDSSFPMSSSKPLHLQQMFDSNTNSNQIQSIYLFGQTKTKRRILQISINKNSMNECSQIVLKSISKRHHIPRPKIQRDTIQMMYEQAQQVIPSNFYNLTTLPPFNLMFINLVNSSIFFLCGGVDYEFWNVNAQSFLYKINNTKNNNGFQSNKTINNQDKKIKAQRPKSIMIPTQRTIPNKKYNKFQRLSFMKQARYSHMGISAKVNSKNYIYVFGGYGSNKQTLKTCQKYSFQKNVWQNILPMKYARATGFCFQFLEKIYVFGGFTQQKKRSKKIQVWDLQNQCWNLLNIKLHQGIQQGFLATFNPNQILVFGGNVEGGKLNQVIRVNIIEETYQWDSNMLYSDTLQKGLQLNKKLYILGGQLPNKCQIYDSKLKLWQQKKILTEEQIKKDQINLFSSLTKPVNVQFSLSKKIKLNQFKNEDLLIFGTDLYPTFLKFHSENYNLIRKSVPMRIRLRKNMGILRISQSEYFICGGIDSFQTNPTKAAYKYCIKTRLVNQLQKMPKKIYNSTLCKFKNFIYSIGGCCQNSKNQQVEIRECFRYNLIENIWEKLPQLNFRRSNSEVVILQKGLLIFGGYCQGQWVQKIEYLNQEDNKQCKVLYQKLPLLFPIHSFICAHDQNQKYKLFIMNYNIHLNNFQQVYYTINLSKFQQKVQKQQIVHDTNLLQRFQQYDSIDVIINNKKQQIQKNYTKHFQKQQNLYKNIQMNTLQISESKIIKQDNSRSIKRQQQNKLIKKVIQQDVSVKQIKMPTLTIIQIKSKNVQTQIINIKQMKKQKQLNKIQVQENIQIKQTKFIQRRKQQNKYIKQIQKQDKKNNNDDQIQQIQFQQRLNLTKQFKKQKLFTQPFDINQSPQNIKQTLNQKLPSLQPIQDSRIKINQSFILQNDISQQGKQKKVIKKLQRIINLNQWLKIRQSYNQQNYKLCFVNNQYVIKCILKVNNQKQNVNIQVNTFKIQNNDSVLASNMLKINDLKQNYT